MLQTLAGEATNQESQRDENAKVNEPKTQLEAFQDEGQKDHRKPKGSDPEHNPQVVRPEEQIFVTGLNITNQSMTYKGAAAHKNCAKQTDKLLKQPHSPSSKSSEGET